jgi:hypothetical protein
MSANDVLSKDEIDALLHSVDCSAVNTTAAELSPGEARGFDLANQARAHQLVAGESELSKKTGADADEDLLRRSFGGVGHALA